MKKDSNTMANSLEKKTTRGNIMEKKECFCKNETHSLLSYVLVTFKNYIWFRYRYRKLKKFGKFGSFLALSIYLYTPSGVVSA